MFTARVYRIMIGCPGDVQEEVQTAIAVINHWTSIYAEQRGIVLIPINWSSNSYPEHGAFPQKILNKQLVSKSDMLVGIFGSKVGTPTDSAESGTIEEIEEHVKAGKPIMLYFRKVNDISETTSEELNRLKMFKANIKDSCLYKEYDSAKDFEKVFTNALNLFLSNHWAGETPSDKQEKQGLISFSDQEIELLSKWTSSNNPNLHYVSLKDGTVFFLGDSQYMINNGRDLVKWNGFINRLQEAGYIEFYKTNRQGDPVYRLTVPAYVFVDSLLD